MAKAKRIFCVIAYDIHDDKLRGKVSKELEKYGYRINLSVFECMFTARQFVAIRQVIDKLIQSKKDSVVYYPICVDCFTRIVYQPQKKKILHTIQVL